MKKKLLMVFLSCTLVLGLIACGHEHVWQDATCTTPRTCNECGEVEGEALGHAWVDATCSEAKHCSACGENEGEALEHTLTEANYQQAATCKVCGAEDGEPLRAENYGIETRAELDVVYDFEIPCHGDYAETYSTVAKVMFTNYNVFESDDTHPAQEGYEWQTVDVICVVGDENGYEYGYQFARYVTDYYWFDNYEDNGDMETFTVNYNGIEYDNCKCIVEVSGDGWLEEEQYGWTKTNTKYYTVSVLMPTGADGYIWGFYDWMSDCWNIEFDENYWGQMPSEEYLFFRFQ